MREQAGHYMPLQALDSFSNMWAYFRAGGYDKTTKDVELLLGRQPQSMKEWIVENKAAFSNE